MTVAIGYLDGPRLRRSFMAAAQWVAAGREELNRINVYPVPDGDTGTNFFLTMKSIAEALQRLGDAPLPDVSRAAAQAAVMGSRGNSGMMLSHFLVGLDEGIGARFRIRSVELATAIRQGFQRLEAALENPVEGTILTVCRSAAAGAQRAAERGADVAGVLRQTLLAAEEELARTPDLLLELKQAGVVDAGGKGFVRMIEGIVRLIDGRLEEEMAEETSFLGAAPAATAEVDVDRDHRYCTEVLVRGPALPSSADARQKLHELNGGSLLVLRTGDLLRVHVHLNDPELLFGMAEEWGEIVTRKAEDMREQHRMLAETTTRPVAILVDSSCDLPDELLDRHGIGLVPLQVMMGDKAYEDRVQMKADAVYQAMRAGQRLTTSQPTVATFANAFAHARAGADAVVGLLLSGSLSGTFNNAVSAAKGSATGGIHLVDSRSASLGLGLLALRAAELAEAGWEPPRIVKEIERLRSQAGMFFTVDTLDNLVRSGRVSRVKGWLGNLLDMKPILSLDDGGRVTPVDRVRGRPALLPRVLELIHEALPARYVRLRMGVVHADAEPTARAIRDALQARFHPAEIIVNPITAVIGVHTGPDSWGVFWQVEDGTLPPGGNKSGEVKL